MLGQFDPSKLMDIALQVPALAVLAVIVKFFLQAMAARDAVIEKIVARTDAAMKAMQDESISARNRSRDVIDNNTRAVAENTRVLAQITDAFDDWQNGQNPRVKT